MPNVYALFWFDVEDCTVPQSDDCARRLAMILTEHNVRGTFKVVGQKARVLEQRVRYKVIDELQKHDIGFHANWHGGRPQIAEYLAPRGWEDGIAEFERRERPGIQDVRRLFGVNPVTYGQPGSNWAPQPFPILRKWGIPTYVSGYGYVGVDCQPFWYGGILCTSHIYGKRFSGEPQRHHMGLNFELGSPGELEKHKAQFSASLEQLSKSGGVISIINHPCTLVLEEWFSSFMKPRELTEAGFEHFRAFVMWTMSLENVKSTCASQLRELYPDRARGRTFSREEVGQIARGLSEEVTFQRVEDVTISASEAFGLLVRFLADTVDRSEMPEGVAWSEVMNPTRIPEDESGERSVSWDAFCESIRSVASALESEGRVPNTVKVEGVDVSPADYLAALARVLTGLLDGGSRPVEVSIRPAERAFEQHVDEDAARRAWGGAMLPYGFRGHKLIELAKMQAWTLKPAVLRVP